MSFVDLSSVFGLSKTLCHMLVDVLLMHFPSVLKQQWVHFSTRDDLDEMAAEFRAIKGVPAVVGAIDGTHIPMKGMEGHRQEYYTRKSCLMEDWEQCFNYCQSATRMAVERCIGAFKGRWRLFAGRSDCKLWRILAGASCGVILHNMCEMMGASSCGSHVTHARKRIFVKGASGSARLWSRLTSLGGAADPHLLIRIWVRGVFARLAATKPAVVTAFGGMQVGHVVRVGRVVVADMRGGGGLLHAFPSNTRILLHPRADEAFEPAHGL
ncbi:unnamed protein product [Closterium sp. NIES-65]|nr:unnamed protein product [Closterium sp. NIES-65]